MAAGTGVLLENERKWKLGRELTLVLKAQEIVQDFLADTKRLELPPDWHDAVSIVRVTDGAEKMQESIKRTVRVTDYMMIVASAKKDAEKLTLKDIIEGKTVESEQGMDEGDQEWHVVAS